MDVETTLHVLRDCQVAKKTWLGLIPLNDQQEFFSQDLQKCSKQFKNGEKPTQREQVEAARSRVDKIICDGAAEQEGLQDGAGGLFRDNKGRFLMGYNTYAGRCLPLVAELWGMRLGLQIAEERNITKLMIETDSEEAMELVARPVTSARCDLWVWEIRQLLSRRGEAQLSTTLRQNNATTLVHSCLPKKA
ncbi:hypothetical protein Scep_012521 [Stephania cephalantha]|uniref:RNase H type-1 domain-containing protein n=1 Tax=Stephania cephalantha TaxID=152367 RepID=A0AAP0JH05_9MAGN